jgi:TDG/mug DNA glycosylase family protein
LCAEFVLERASGRVPAALVRPTLTAPSSVPDILAPGLRAVFCGINPGRASAAAGAHFANPRNDFWRLLADAGLTPRRFDPAEQQSLLELGFGLTNAARRTTSGSSELRRGDFAGTAERLEGCARLPPARDPLVKAAYEERSATTRPAQAALRGPSLRVALDLTANAAVLHESGCAGSRR